MNFEQYQELRSELLTEIEGLITENKIEESDTKMQEVKDLDNKWEGIKLANANLNALKDSDKATDIENKSVEVKGGQIVDKTEDQVKNESKLYENAWAKSLMNQDMTQDERSSF